MLLTDGLALFASSLRHHGTTTSKTPGFQPNSPSGSSEPTKSDPVVASHQRLQTPLHPHGGSTHPVPVTGQRHLHPDPFAWLLHPSSWNITLGTVSASRLHPALSWDENQVIFEEALQRLFLCQTEGPSVCLLQDKSEAQAEAGLMGWRMVKIAFVIVNIV